MTRLFPAKLAMLVVLGCSPPSGKLLKPESFMLKTLDGEVIDMQVYKGKTIFINVWATWCKPCRQEMPTIEAAKDKLQDRGVVFLFASPEGAESIAAFRDQSPFPFEFVQIENHGELSITALPATFIFDPNGNLLFGEEGFRDWSAPENLKILTNQQQ